MITGKTQVNGVWKIWAVNTVAEMPKSHEEAAKIVLPFEYKNAMCAEFVSFCLNCAGADNESFDNFQDALNKLRTVS